MYKSLSEWANYFKVKVRDRPITNRDRMHGTMQSAFFASEHPTGHPDKKDTEAWTQRMVYLDDIIISLQEQINELKEQLNSKEKERSTEDRKEGS